MNPNPCLSFCLRAGRLFYLATLTCGFNLTMGYSFSYERDFTRHLTVKQLLIDAPKVCEKLKNLGSRPRAKHFQSPLPFLEKNHQFPKYLDPHWK